MADRSRGGGRKDHRW
jgi:hypothetical protein